MTKPLASLAVLFAFWGCGTSSEQMDPCNQWEIQGKALYSSLGESLVLSAEALEQKDSLALEKSMLLLKATLDSCALPEQKCASEKSLAPSVKALHAELQNLQQKTLPSLRLLFAKELSADQEAQVKMAVEHLATETPVVLHHFASITVPQLEQVRNDSLE